MKEKLAEQLNYTTEIMGTRKRTWIQMDPSRRTRRRIKSPLHLASLDGDTENVKSLILWGADVNVCDNVKMTPLHLASMKGHTEVVKALIHYGADVNVCDNFKMTPLHLASKNGHTSCVANLLDNLPTVDATKESKETPLYLAGQKGHAEVVDVLLSPNVSDFNIPTGTNADAKKERRKRDVEIRDFVFSVSLPGVKITHCNFGKTRVEVWYIESSEKTDDENFEEDLRKEIEPHVNPYTLKLVKKDGAPTFKYTSPGHTTNLSRAHSSIGTYVTLTDTRTHVSNMHALMAGHDKRRGDIIYLNQNPNQRIGEVQVVKEGERHISVASGDWANTRSGSYDVGLVLLDQQQLNTTQTSVTTHQFGAVRLANVQATLFPDDMDDYQDVMLFNNDNVQGRANYTNYNNQATQKYGMIGITREQGAMQQAVHRVTESGTLVAALPPYSENGENLVKAVGMLVGVEEFGTNESISLAVPIGTNLQELQEDEYCANQEIEFA